MRPEEIEVGKTYRGEKVATAVVLFKGRVNIRAYDPADPDKRVFVVDKDSFARWAQSEVTRDDH